MKINCYVCNKQLDEPGAILISPPFKMNNDNSICSVHKYHICTKCFKPLMDAIEELEKKDSKHELKKRCRRNK